MSKKPKVIDLFCGCGGLSQGFIDAGYKISLGVDKWADAIETFNFNHTVELFPYEEDFILYPAPGVSIINPDDHVYTWVSTGQVDQDCSGNLNQMMYLNNRFYSSPGEKDFLRLPIFDLSQFSSATLTFDVAYVPRSVTNSDTLEVEVSSACGTPNVEFSKGGLTLATNDPPAYFTGVFYKVNIFVTATIQIFKSEFWNFFLGLIS